MKERIYIIIIVLLLIKTAFAIHIGYNNEYTIIKLGRDYTNVFVQITNKTIQIKKYIKKGNTIAVKLPYNNTYICNIIKNNKPILSKRISIDEPPIVIIQKIIYTNKITIKLKNNIGSIYYKLISDKHNISGMSQKSYIKINSLTPSTHYILILKAGKYKKTITFTTKPINIAFNKPVYGNFTGLPYSKYIYDATPVITRVNDGKYDWYYGMATSGSVYDRDRFIIINLKGIFNIKSTKVYWSALSYPEQYSVLYSKDGKNWIEKNIKSSKREIISSHGNRLVLDNIKLDKEIAYIGIMVKRGTKIIKNFPYKDYVQIAEIEVYN